MQPLTLLMDFDVNRTMVFQDSIQRGSDEQSLVSIFADHYQEDWGQKGGQSESKSFTRYVTEELKPCGSTYVSKKFKEEMFSWLEVQDHPKKERAVRKFTELKEKVLDPNTRKFKTSVFRSVFTLMERLRNSGVTFVVKLRTFGRDTEMVKNALSAHENGIKITRIGRFTAGKLSLEGGGVIARTDQIFRTFLESKEHFAISDDYNVWSANGYHSLAGKPFIFDSRGANCGVRHLSLFFDDHFSGIEEDDIICPVDVAGQKVLGSDLSERMLFKVNTIEAFEDDNYYVNLVRKALKANSLEVPGF